VLAQLIAGEFQNVWHKRNNFVNFSKINSIELWDGSLIEFC
jgi:hypothetical protein